MRSASVSVIILFLLRAQIHHGSPVPVGEGSSSSQQRSDASPSATSEFFAGLAEQPLLAPPRGNQPLTDYYLSGSGSMAPYSFYSSGTNSANTLFVGPNNPFQSAITRLGYPASPFLMGLPSTGFPTTGSFFTDFTANGGLASVTQPFLTTQQYLGYPNTMQLYPSLNQQYPSISGVNQPTTTTSLSYPSLFRGVQNTNQQSQQFPGNQNNQISVYSRAPQTYPLTTSSSNGYPTFTNSDFSSNNQIFSSSQRGNPYFPTTNLYFPGSPGTTTTRLNPYLPSTQSFPGTVDLTNTGGAPNIPGRNLKQDPMTGMRYLEDTSTGVWMFVDNNGIPLPVKFLQEGIEVLPGTLNSFVEPGDGRRIYINKMGQPVRVSSSPGLNNPLSTGLLGPNPVNPVNPVVPVDTGSPRWPFQVNQG